MGFFDKIKNTFSQLTGGTGNVQLQLSSGQVRRGESINVTLTVNATGQLSYRGVYVELVGTEHVKYQVQVSTPLTTTSSGPSSPAAVAAAVGAQTAGKTLDSTPQMQTQTQEETRDNVTYQHSDTLESTSVQMTQGQSKQYTATVQVPADAQPTYKGVQAQHTWKVRAHVDVPMGADPGTEAEITVL
jgi:hypothetical protein